MGSQTDRLVSAIRAWSLETESPDYALVFWAQLYLGWPYQAVGAHPDLDAMTPVQKARLPMGQHTGHPTIEQLRDRFEALTATGLWEPFLVSSVARCIGDQLDELADGEAIAQTRQQLRGDLDAFANNEDQRRRWVSALREQQVNDQIPLDDLATDKAVEEFVQQAKARLQPLSETEIAARRHQADSWHRLAADLMDFRAESQNALMDQE